MWVSRREITRLERELKNALQRADCAEERLQAERSSKDWLITQLTSRVITKHGGYGLDHEPNPLVTTPAHPRGFIREPTELDEVKLEYYKRCARERGLPEEDAVMKWESEMRGEMPTYDAEQEQ